MEQKINSISLIDVAEEKAVFLLKDYIPIPKNAVTLLSALGATGKTRTALIMASKFIIETGEKVALWLTEDYEGQVRAIVNSLVAEGLIREEVIPKMIIIKENSKPLARREGGLFKANDVAFDEIYSWCKLKEIGFIVFDPMLSFYGGNENDNSEATIFMNSFVKCAKNYQVTTMIIHHSSKTGGTRGASAFVNCVRCAYELYFPLTEKGEKDFNLIKKGIRRIILTKDNWGAFEFIARKSEGENSFMIKIAPETKEEPMVEIVEFDGGLL